MPRLVPTQLSPPSGCAPGKKSVQTPRFLTKKRGPTQTTMVQSGWKSQRRLAWQRQGAPPAISPFLKPLKPQTSLGGVACPQRLSPASRRKQQSVPKCKTDPPCAPVIFSDFHRKKPELPTPPMEMPTAPPGGRRRRGPHGSGPYRCLPTRGEGNFRGESFAEKNQPVTFQRPATSLPPLGDDSGHSGQNGST